MIAPTIKHIYTELVSVPMKVLFVNNLKWDWSTQIEALRREFPDHEFVEDTKRDSEHLADAEVMVVYALSHEQLEKAEKLKCVLIPYTGVNMFDLGAFKARGIVMGNSHGNGRAVAEHAVALALALLNQIPWRQEELRKGYWHRSFSEPDFWPGLTGKRCAVLGTGGVGTHIAGLVKAFDCPTIGYKRSPVSEPMEYFDTVTTDIDTALEQADVVFICLPGTEETRGLISRPRLERMSGKYIVNVARGPIIAEEDLHWALSENVLAGAALDVWYKYSGKQDEPVFPSEFGIHELPNVVISPHNSTHNHLAKDSDLEQTADNIRSFISSGSPVNVVDLDKGY